MKTPTLQLPLGWNPCLLFNSDIVNFVWKADEGGTESIVLFIFARVVGWGRKSYLGPAEIASFSSLDLS